MQQEKTQRVQRLLEQYRAVYDKTNDHSASIKLQKISALLDDFRPFLLQLKEAHRISTPHYNVFNIFRYDYNEVKIHTPLLHNFLSIDGSHAQGSLFFDSFLKHTLHQADNIFTCFQGKYLQVKREFPIPEGRIDIFILHSSPQKEQRFAIIIENKLNAGDGVAQLDKYYKYAKSILNLSDAQILVVYLKPNMSDPSDLSISKELKKHLVEQNTLKTIGYNPHIKNWLTLCSAKIESQKLKQIILQYTELINQITYEEEQ